VIAMTLQYLLDFFFAPQCGSCEQPGTGLCERCFPPQACLYTRLHTLHIVALGAYEGSLRRAIVALKSGRRDVARAFAARLVQAVPRNAALVPVPTTAGRRRERGFDGCELIARHTIQLTMASLRTGLVQTRGDRQRGRGREERLSAKGRFGWRGAQLTGQTVILLDDVVTTGATLEDCASALRSAGARVEQAIVLARA
jgi:ComF family protein